MQSLFGVSVFDFMDGLNNVESDKFHLVLTVDDYKHTRGGLEVTVDPSNLVLHYTGAIVHDAELGHCSLQTPVGMLSSDCPADWKLFDLRLGDGVTFRPTGLVASAGVGFVGSAEDLSRPANFLAPLLPHLLIHSSVDINIFGEVKCADYRAIEASEGDVLTVDQLVGVPVDEDQLVQTEHGVKLVIGSGDCHRVSVSDRATFRAVYKDVAALKAGEIVKAPPPSCRASPPRLSTGERQFKAPKIEHLDPKQEPVEVSVKPEPSD